MHIKFLNRIEVYNVSKIVELEDKEYFIVDLKSSIMYILKPEEFDALESDKGYFDLFDNKMTKEVKVKAFTIPSSEEIIFPHMTESSISIYNDTYRAKSYIRNDINGKNGLLIEAGFWTNQYEYYVLFSNYKYARKFCNKLAKTIELKNRRAKEVSNLTDEEKIGKIFYHHRKTSNEYTYVFLEKLGTDKNDFRCFYGKKLEVKNGSVFYSENRRIYLYDHYVVYDNKYDRDITDFRCLKKLK